MRRLLLISTVALGALALAGCGGGGVGEECRDDDDCARGLVCKNVLQCVKAPCDGAWQCQLPDAGN